MRRISLVLSMFVLVSMMVLGSSPASAQGNGNSGAAQACKNGGWAELLRSDKTAFRNQGQCVSYAAQGGSFWEPPTVQPVITAQLGMPSGTYGDTFSVEVSGTDFNSFVYQESINLNVLLYDGNVIMGGTGYRTQPEANGEISHTFYDSEFHCTPVAWGDQWLTPDRIEVTAENSSTNEVLAETTISPGCSLVE